eukprot:gb/GECH01011346.1/.p1 GENE.gb/GECH01011346.1/~~gb/GECH01011346.1/.p1  ORF type:complete len:348 (+),score=83.76 gb/GECH01011346.1/:1-1044(+)
MKFLAIVFCFLITFLFADAQLSWDSCGSNGFKMDSVTLSPKAPVVGQKLEVKAAGTFNEKVTAGKVKLKVHYGFIPIVDKTHDICNLSPEFPCPLSGKESLDHTVTVPDEAPAGKYTGKVHIHDQNSNEIGCIDFTLHLNDKSSYQDETDSPLIDDDLIEDVNRQGLWKASAHGLFRQMTVSQGQEMLHAKSLENNAVDGFANNVVQYLPSRFDAREKWTDCIQSSAANDRFCIHNDHKATQSFQVGELAMMHEIYNNGPIEATIDIYRDFFGYHGGVYSHVSGSFIGEHTIKIIGWDFEELTQQPYWIAENTFGSKWGMNDYFWILRGNNEVNIENNKPETAMPMF